MRFTIIVAGILFITGACNSVKKPIREDYRWVTIETIPKDHGKIIGAPQWNAPLRINDVEADTFTIYSNNDSIFMRIPRDKEGQMFKKVNIHSAWKAKPQYGGQLFFMGNYVTPELDGLYASFYCTSDRSTLMQVFYTNPGNMFEVILFGRDSVNILRKAGVLVDPRQEMSEPERPVPAGAAP
jgi:hypothetical protein